MAWLVLLLGAGLLLWGLAGLRAHDRRLGAVEERMAQLAGDLAAAGEAVLHAADLRLAELEEAVAAADRRLAALRGDAAAAATPATLGLTESGTADGGGDGPATAGESRSGPPGRSSMGGPSGGAQGGHTGGRAEDDTAAALMPAAEAVPPQHRAVWRLGDAGQDEAAIARETGLLVGEVRLILGLRRLQRR